MGPLYLIGLAVWLTLGLVADRLCEWQARVQGHRHERSTVVACYLFGPVILPLAFGSALLRGMAHMFRRH